MRRANLKTKIMNKAQKFLLENNLDDIVLNAKQYPENTQENAKEWVYLSDVLEQYLEQNQALRIHNVVGRSEQLVCGSCNRELDQMDKQVGLCYECGYELATES